MGQIILVIEPIKQRSMHCGPACIEMILKFYGFKYVDQGTIGRDIRVMPRKGCFPNDVIKYLRRYNIEAIKSKNLDDLKEIEKGHPIVLGQKDHFMLLIGVEGEKLIYIDPYVGKKYKTSLSEFKETKDQTIIDLVIIKKVEIPNGAKKE